MRKSAKQNNTGSYEVDAIGGVDAAQSQHNNDRASKR